MVHDVPGTHSGALGDYACSSGVIVPQNHYIDNPTASGAMIVGSALGLDTTGQWVTSWRATLSFTRIRDGLSNTIFVGEKHVPEAWFTRSDRGDGLVYEGVHPPYAYARIAGPGFPLAGPNDLSDTGPSRFGSFHPGICQFVMGDGSVRAVQVSLAEDVLYRLAHRADGQPMPDF